MIFIIYYFPLFLFWPSYFIFFFSVALQKERTEDLKSALAEVITWTPPLLSLSLSLPLSLSLSLSFSYGLFDIFSCGSKDKDKDTRQKTIFLFLPMNYKIYYTCCNIVNKGILFIYRLIRSFIKLLDCLFGTAYSRTGKILIRNVIPFSSSWTLKPLMSMGELLSTIGTYTVSPI